MAIVSDPNVATINQHLRYGLGYKYVYLLVADAKIRIIHAEIGKSKKQVGYGVLRVESLATGEWIAPGRPCKFEFC